MASPLPFSALFQNTPVRLSAKGLSMTAEALKAQAEYARALGQTQWGYPLLVPTGEPEVGDVAYLLGSTYTKVFNVFRLNQDVISPFLS